MQESERNLVKIIPSIGKGYRESIIRLQAPYENNLNINTIVKKEEIENKLRDKMLVISKKHMTQLYIEIKYALNFEIAL